MKKVIATTLGIVLATSAVSALAGKEDRANLAQCKADVEAYYGDGARTRLRSINRAPDATHLRLMVTPPDGGNRVVVCSVSEGGATSLANQDGVALVVPAVGDAVTLAQ